MLCHTEAAKEHLQGAGARPTTRANLPNRIATGLLVTYKQTTSTAKEGSDVGKSKGFGRGMTEHPLPAQLTEVLEFGRSSVLVDSVRRWWVLHGVIFPHPYTARGRYCGRRSKTIDTGLRSR